MRALIVIPSRWASTRFPGKPLAEIAGVSLVQRVWQRVRVCRYADDLVVATDDPRIESHVHDFGGRAVMTPSELPSGTDRIASALDQLDGTWGIIINVQGDEPLIDPGDVDRMIAVLRDDKPDMVTLAAPIRSDEEFESRDVVKVVTDLAGNALYFSRSPIPHGGAGPRRRHVGVYGYQAEALRRFTSLSPSPLEMAESLEQLRALQNGLTIRVIETPRSHQGVDRPEDVRRVERELAGWESSDQI